MARLIEFDKFLIIESSASELYVATGGTGLCDSCARPSDKGYYIAVLNRWFCPECFEKWKSTARYYPEDMEIEIRNFDFYAPRFGINVSKS